MRYYERYILRRVPVNSYGKLGFREYHEYFKTEDAGFVAAANYRKKVRFAETSRDATFDGIRPDFIASVPVV